MATAFGTELKRWRSIRRLSQLDLAGVADVSQRHISFLETGRASPSREMVIHLATAMDVPLRSRNGLLGAAGYAPAYKERGLHTPELSSIAGVLERLLTAHEPFPAYVVDRLWNIQQTNLAASALIASVAPPGFRPDLMKGNALRLLLHPDGLRPSVANWDTAARVLVDRLRREAREHPDDVELGALLEEASGLLGSPPPSDAKPASADELLVPLVLRTPVGLRRFFTTIATIGAAYDVTLEELRIESLLPADDEAEDYLRGLL